MIGDKHIEIVPLDAMFVYGFMFASRQTITASLTPFIPFCNRQQMFTSFHCTWKGQKLHKNWMCGTRAFVSLPSKAKAKDNVTVKWSHWKPKIRHVRAARRLNYFFYTLTAAEKVKRQSKFHSKMFTTQRYGHCFCDTRTTLRIVRNWWIEMCLEHVSWRTHTHIR